MPQQRKRHVAAHRQAADDGVVNVQRVEQIDDVTGVVVDRAAGGSPDPPSKPRKCGAITRQPRSDSAS
jgi:hypothetical protein